MNHNPYEQEVYYDREPDEALRLLEETEHSEEFVTGLIYFNPVRESLAEAANLPDTPLALLPDEVIRPSKESLADVMASLQ